VALRRQVLLVIGPYPVDVPAERGRPVVLAPVALALEARHRRELHVFVLVVDVLGPLAQPLDGGVVPHLPPGATGHVASGRRGALRHVDHDLLGGHALLELPHLRMLSAPSECAGGFHFFRWEGGSKHGSEHIMLRRREILILLDAWFRVGGLSAPPILPPSHEEETNKRHARTNAHTATTPRA